MVAPRPQRLVALLLVALFLPWPTAVAPDARAAPQLLRFAAATLDPSSAGGGGDLFAEPIGFEGPWVVQFPYPLTGGEGRALEAAGGRVEAYVPDGGLVVSGPAGLGGALRALGNARFVGALPPEFKVAQGASGPGRFFVQLGAGAALFDAALALAGASPVVSGAGFAVVDSPRGPGVLARLPQVLWVEPYGAPRAENARAVVTDGVRAALNSTAYSPASGALWTLNSGSSGPRFLGYAGQGYAVDVTDEGVDGTHPAFSGRVGASRSWSSAPALQDTVGHGTHVAGTALGDGAYFAGDAAGPAGLYAGVAPSATLVAQTYDAAAMNYSGMAQFASAAGATASVNSWGDASPAAQGAYTGVASTYDGLTADASPEVGLQPLLFVFSAGNLDNAPGSVTAPSTAKNVLSVGATGNGVPGATSPSDIAAFSAFGPADDGRIKPDLVAPGELVASANSSQRGSPPGPPFPPMAGRSYVYLSGTSQAAPQVAGAAAVATEFLNRTRGLAATPALLRALLINGASPLPGYPWPGPAQGWGRLDLAASLLDLPTRRVELVPEGNYSFFSAPDVVEYATDVLGGTDLRVTLAWTDLPGSPLAAASLVNDLDLEVRDENGTLVFAGNDINRTSGFSNPGSGTAFDRVNNVEVVRIRAAHEGRWRIFVRAHNLAQGPQKFALAVSGSIDRPQVTLAPAAAVVVASLRPGLNDVPVVLHNAGVAGEAEAPTVEGGFPAWSYRVTPANQTAAAGANVTFHLIVDTGQNASARVTFLNLSFYPNSSRSGELRLPVELTLAEPPPPPPPPPSPWPTDARPLVAALAGALAAFGVALAAARSRGLMARCPACGHTPPRFDTFMNPTCTQCGGSLAKAPPPPGDPR